MEHCREETIHPVTIEVAETWHDGVPTFQARCRLDAIVIEDIGPPQDTEIAAFDQITRAFQPTPLRAR